MGSVYLILADIQDGGCLASSVTNFYLPDAIVHSTHTNALVLEGTQDSYCDV